MVTLEIESRRSIRLFLPSFLPFFLSSFNLFFNQTLERIERTDPLQPNCFSRLFLLEQNILSLIDIIYLLIYFQLLDIFKIIIIEESVLSEFSIRFDSFLAKF